MAKKENTEVSLDILTGPKAGQEEVNISTSAQEVIKSLEDTVKKLTHENDSLKEQVNQVTVLVSNKNASISILEDKVKELTGALKEAGEVIKTQADHIGGQMKDIEKLLEVATPVVEAKDVVIAVRNGVEREFPRLAWDAIGAEKGGWRIKVEAPEEAK